MAVIDPNVYSRALHFAVDAIEQAVSKHGERCTYEHIMAELAESATRELPEGTHYLRNAVSEADAANEKRKAEQEAWELACESGFYSKSPVIRLRDN